MEALSDTISIRRVANGWIIQPGGPGPSPFAHVAMSAEEVAEHVRKWAMAAVDAPPIRK